jgi:hypothetical protein
MLWAVSEYSRSLRFCRLASRKCRVVPAFFGVVLAAATIAASTFGLSQPALALPSFARQTGQPCGTCHTYYPQLTPYGRLFKLNGYTTGGGKFRTTLFPSQFDSTNALAAYAKKADGDMATTLSGQRDMSNVWVPPIAMMAIYGYTHTQKDQVGLPPFTAQDLPGLGPYHANDNANLSQLSIFYGGAITDHIGLFSQTTYGNAPPGNSAIDPGTGAVAPATNPCWNCEWSWDNTDLRYANTGMLGPWSLVYGITANNNPTVQDPWNTTPAWGFPQAGSNVAPGPAAATQIDGAYSGYVGGVGGYAFIDNLVYLELTAYRTLDNKTLPKLGMDPFGMPGPFAGWAPYWRVAIEPHWGRNWLEFGAFGIFEKVRTWAGVDSNGDGTGIMLPQTLPQTDKYTDVAFDTQYQYQGDNYWFTLRATYIHELQKLDATFNNPAGAGSSNPTNTLNTLRAYASLAYGNDNRIVLAGQYFDTRGSSDPLLYGAVPLNSCVLTANCSPDSNGWVAEIDYIPYMTSTAPLWPWANVRLGLQYTYYNKFDGTTAYAHDNNTLFLFAWFAM